MMESPSGKVSSYGRLMIDDDYSLIDLPVRSMRKTAVITYRNVTST